MKITHTLSSETICDVSKKDSGTLAILIKNFYPEDLSKKAAEKAISHSNVGSYGKKFASVVNRIGMPHVDTLENQSLLNRYHSEAIPSIHDIRKLFYPSISPVDHLRLLLQELWPSGANIQQLNEKTCFTGAIRLFAPKVGTFIPHTDRIETENDAPELKDIAGQLAANIYLNIPKQGGELCLWDREATPEEEVVIKQLKGLDMESLSPPAIKLSPSAGDLIIFNSRKLHAVTPCVESTRVSMATFIGIYGENRPLTYWS